MPWDAWSGWRATSPSDGPTRCRQPTPRSPPAGKPRATTWARQSRRCAGTRRQASPVQAGGEAHAGGARLDGPLPGLLGGTSGRARAAPGQAGKELAMPELADVREPSTLRLTRTVAAPRERVFRAWTE